MWLIIILFLVAYCCCVIYRPSPFCNHYVHIAKRRGNGDHFGVTCRSGSTSVHVYTPHILMLVLKVMKACTHCRPCLRCWFVLTISTWSFRVRQEATDRSSNICACVLWKLRATLYVHLHVHVHTSHLPAHSHFWFTFMIIPCEMAHIRVHAMYNITPTFK